MKYWDKSTINKIRHGFYSAVYFNRTQQLLLSQNDLTPVTMQVFQKQDNVTIAGIAVILSLFKKTVGYFHNNKWSNKFHELSIVSVPDGTKVNGWETIMHITGPYAYFAHLESLYLGILARASLIATNTNEVIHVAQGKPVIFFADRFDYFLNQSLDGYAAHIGGISAVSTEAHGAYWHAKPMGTLPHALIAISNGNTIRAADRFAACYPKVPLIVLVDFDNDCVKTTLRVAKHFGKRLYAVRLDTSETMVDKSFTKKSDTKQYGVNIELVRRVRNALDKEGFSYVKIVVSGGFTQDKIAKFELENTPVDLYGVGSSLMRGSVDCTADIVLVNGEPRAKQGRKFRPNRKLIRMI